MKAIFKSSIKNFIFPAVTLLIIAFPFPAYGGNGTFKDGKFNFCVSVRFEATEAQLARIRAGLQAGSDILADATDGQHRFGTIDIINNGRASESAELWIVGGTGRGGATSGLYGQRGQHIFLYMDSTFNTGNTATGYVVAHEFGHHVYGLGDEYQTRSVAGATPAECAIVPDPVGLNYCIMDDFYRRGVSPPSLNEFCVATNHDPDHNTAQSYEHNNQSCWETILSKSSKYPITSPPGLPMSDPPPSQQVTFNTVTGPASGALRAMLVIDRSGSMAEESRMTFAKAGGTLFTTLFNVLDYIGVVSFDRTPTLNMPLTLVSSPNGEQVLNTAKNAINSLVADGGTNIGDALQTALGQFTSNQEGKCCNDIIILISDGEHEFGTPPSAVIPSLKDAGVTVFSVIVGTTISAQGSANLSTVSTATGGLPHRIANVTDIPAILAYLSGISKLQGPIKNAPEMLALWELPDNPQYLVILERG